MQLSSWWMYILYDIGAQQFSLCCSTDVVLDDPSDSDTVALLDGTEIDYDFKFGSGEVTGAYITDGIAFSGVTIKSIIIGLTDASANTGRGIMGVGLPQGEQPFITPHPGVIGALYKQGSISANSYSLYLNSYSKWHTSIRLESMLPRRF